MTQTGPYNDPNEIYIIDPNRTSISVNSKLQQLCPYRHAYLSLYQVLSRQSMCILYSVNISYSRIIIIIRQSYVKFTTIYSFHLDKLYLHLVYFSIHPITNTHRGKYKFTLKPIFSISLFLFFTSLRTPTLFFL